MFDQNMVGTIMVFEVSVKVLRRVAPSNRPGFETAGRGTGNDSAPFE